MDEDRIHALEGEFAALRLVCVTIISSLDPMERLDIIDSLRQSLGVSKASLLSPRPKSMQSFEGVLDHVIHESLSRSGA